MSNSSVFNIWAKVLSSLQDLQLNERESLQLLLNVLPQPMW